MEKYDYYEAVQDSVREYIEEEIDLDEWKGRRDALESILNNKLFIEDAVTGNASGSYFCNAWKAEEAICHNLDLLAEACQEFDSSIDVLNSGAEACDVTIRCYVLASCISDVLDELEEEGAFDEEEEEETKDE